jgi:hypothetical protein
MAAVREEHDHGHRAGAAALDQRLIGTLERRRQVGAAPGGEAADAVQDRGDVVGHGRDHGGVSGEGNHADAVIAYVQPLGEGACRGLRGAQPDARHRVGRVDGQHHVVAGRGFAGTGGREAECDGHRPAHNDGARLCVFHE